MELLPIARIAWQRRWALALGLPLAILVFLALARGAPGQAGVATARLVVDTPVSQLVNAADLEVHNLAWRSEILTNLMTTRASRETVARAAGVDPDELEVINPWLNEPVLPMTLPRRATQGIAPKAPNVLLVAATPSLPLVTLDASAPTRDGAERLLRAGAQQMTELAAAPAGLRKAQPIVVARGEIESREIITGGGRMSAVLAALMMYVTWCAASLLLGPPRTMIERAGRSPARA
ncbi:MAG: hypothetical protein LC798_04460 [Chloroflexi bacterium]|nr:hypothetical protein [Chloroflexota bacterium]